MKKMNLSSVKLVQGGLKGIEVTYAQQEIKNNRSFLNEFKSKRKSPIHQQLEDCFKWLKGDMLKICGYNHEDQALLSALEMTTVNYSDKGFILEAELSVWTGILKLKTPLIVDGNQYEDFAAVAAILDGIYTETKEYMTGNKVMDDAQLVMRFNAGKEGFDEEAFKKLPKEEQQALATKILEDAGCIVLQNDDFEEAAPETFTLTHPETGETAVINLKDESDTIKASFTSNGAPFTTGAKIIEMGDDFHIVMPPEPVKVSTAKRK